MDDETIEKLIKAVKEIVGIDYESTGALLNYERFPALKREFEKASPDLPHCEYPYARHH